MSHTPGPWTASRWVGEACAIDAPTWEELALVNGQEDVPHPKEADRLWLQARANGRLIAAAPDLLEALKELVARCDGAEGVRADGSNIQTIKAHAAIAKAEGK